MTRGHIEYLEKPDQVTLAYRLPSAVITLEVWLWCGIGGLAVGTALAMGLSTAGTVGESRDAWLSFRAAALLGTLMGAALLYGVVYLPASRRRILRVTFDYAAGAIGAVVAGLERQPVWYAFTDVLAVRLVDRLFLWRASCALIFDTRSDGPVVVIAIAQRRNMERTGLPHLVEQLNTRLEAARATPDIIPPIPHATPKTIGVSIPVVPAMPDQPFDSDLPPDPDVFDQQFS